MKKAEIIHRTESVTYNKNGAAIELTPTEKLMFEIYGIEGVTKEVKVEEKELTVIYYQNNQQLNYFTYSFMERYYPEIPLTEIKTVKL